MLKDSTRKLGFRFYLKLIALREWLQALARLQNGQGAEQPGCVQSFSCHTGQIAFVFQPVHRVVTPCLVTFPQA